MKARFTYATSTLVAVLLILVAACSENTLVEDPTFASTEQEISPAKNGNQVMICHFPPDNPDYPQVITVGGKAAEAHIAKHDGDGVVGEDYDEDCEPLAVACPCWEAPTLDLQRWHGEIDDWTDGVDGGRYILEGHDKFGVVDLIVGSSPRPGCAARPRHGDTMDPALRPIEQPSSLDEKQACVDLLREYAPQP